MAVLVVEDDADTAAALQFMLAGEGIDVTCAATLPGALEAAAREPPPDAILLDLILPPPNSVDATIEIIPALAARSVVVVVSARSDRATIDAALAAGATRFWIKGEWRPPERMKRALKRCIEQRRLEKKIAENRAELEREDVPDRDHGP